MVKLLKFLILFAISGFVLSGCTAPGTEPRAVTLSSPKQQFVQAVEERTREVNQNILKDRARLLKLHAVYQSKKALSDQDVTWLHSLAESYRIQNPSFSQASTWKELQLRVDVVPASLVLAQAINESAWGRSRFARQGDNYFGQHCYSKGCGIVPKQRASGSTFEVRRFISMMDSIRQYMHNINVSVYYHPLRQLRQQLRGEQKPITGAVLALKLERYSERRGDYVKSLQNIIQHYQLERFDA